MLRPATVALTLLLPLSAAAEVAGDARSQSYDLRLLEEIASDQGLRRAIELASTVDTSDIDEALLDRLREETGVEMWAKSLEERAADWREYGRTLTDILERIELVADTTARRTDRRSLVLAMGHSAPHTVFLPLLQAVAENPNEDYTIRYGALSSISRIPDKDVIPILIQFIDDPELDHRAVSQLGKITGVRPRGVSNAREITDFYDQWWNEHRETFEYDLLTLIRALEER